MAGSGGVPWKAMGKDFANDADNGKSGGDKEKALMVKKNLPLLVRRKTGQIYKVEARTHGTLALKLPLYQKLVVGSVSGVLGTICVYPIDFVKTRIQNLRREATRTGAAPSATVRSVVSTTMKEAGAIGFYRGLLPTLVGVAPEKAIKLGVNDWLRDVVTPNRYEETVRSQTFCGAMTGVIQTAATNPMEATKIRTQMNPGISVAGIVRDLGIRGLYRGSLTSMARDVPYNCVFFPTYIFLKRNLTLPDGTVSKPKVAFSGVVAGMVAAVCATPMDVVNTRMKNTGNTFKTVFKGVLEEGIPSFFKGAALRSAVLGPLYGVSLLCFEMQKKFMSKRS
eukprot:g4577.t1